MSEEKEDDMVLGGDIHTDERLEIVQNQSDLILTLLDVDASQYPKVKDDVATVIVKALRVIHRVQCHLMEAYPSVKGQKDL
jgi:predicted GTPase